MTLALSTDAGRRTTRPSAPSSGQLIIGDVPRAPGADNRLPGP